MLNTSPMSSAITVAWNRSKHFRLSMPNYPLAESPSASTAPIARRFRGISFP